MPAGLRDVSDVDGGERKVLADPTSSGAPPVWLLFGASAACIAAALRFGRNMRSNPFISDRLRPAVEVIYLAVAVLFAIVLAIAGIAQLVAG